MKRLWIAGAGGFGRELFHWVKQHPDHGRHWTFFGFLDDNLRALEGLNYPGTTVRALSSFVPQPEDTILLGVGAPRTKKLVAAKLRASGAGFLTFVHPSAVLGGNIRMGEGCVLCPNAVISADVALGDFVMLNFAATAGHDSRLGDFCTLGPHSDVTGGAVLEEGAFLGSGARVIPGCRVGAWSTIGAGSVATIDVPAGQTAFGVPGRLLPYRPPTA